MSPYETVRRQYRPKHIKLLFIAESPPPPSEIQSSRQFYFTDRIRRDDRLFTNTMKALYPDAAALSELELEKTKAEWLRRFQNDGFYMIEALEKSQPHKVTKQQRQKLIRENLSELIRRLRKLVGLQTKLILIKSNVYEVTAEPLRQAGFNVLNTGLVDYPGQFNQRAYREKLSDLVSKAKEI
jgi:hypothetical protein